MPIGRTARGTNYDFDDIALITSLTISGVSNAAGSTVLVAVAFDSASAPTSVTLNGVALTLKVTDSWNFRVLNLWVKENAAANTAVNVVITFAPGDKPAHAEAFVTEITGAKAASWDKSASFHGTSTTPSSGDTATTAQANEMLIGAVSIGNTDAPTGSWSGSFTAGQAVSNALDNGWLGEGFRSVTATGAYSAARTGDAAGSDWVAAIATFMEEPPAPQTSTPAKISMLATVRAAVGLPGPRSVAPATIALVATAKAAVGLIGQRTLTPATISMLATCRGPEVGAMTFKKTAPSSPTAITSVAFELIRAASPAALGDGDATTFVADAVSPGGTPANPAGGSIGVAAATMQAPIMPADATIDYVKFRAIAYRAEIFDPPTHDNYRMEWTLAPTTNTAPITNDTGYIVGLVTGDIVIRLFDDVLDPGDAIAPDWYVGTGAIALAPDGGAWTAAKLAALTNVKVALDYAAGNEWCEVEVCEIWIEVYGPVGRPILVSTRQKMRSPLRKIRMQSGLGG